MGGTCRARECAPGRYQPRRPSQSVLYRCVQERLATWLAHRREVDDDDGSVPDYVEREFRRYLDWPSSIGAVSFAIINGVLSLEYVSGFAMA